MFSHLKTQDFLKVQILKQIVRQEGLVVYYQDLLNHNVPYISFSSNTQKSSNLVIDFLYRKQTQINGIFDNLVEYSVFHPKAQLVISNIFLFQVSITDYVVFDQCSLFQTIIQATHSVATAAQAPVEKVADKLRMAFWSQQLQCQPSLLGVNGSGVWISSGKNEFHVAKGNLIGQCDLSLMFPN